MDQEEREGKWVPEGLLGKRSPAVLSPLQEGAAPEAAPADVQHSRTVKAVEA